MPTALIVLAGRSGLILLRIVRASVSGMALDLPLSQASLSYTELNRLVKVVVPEQRPATPSAWSVAARPSIPEPSTLADNWKVGSLTVDLQSVETRPAKPRLVSVRLVRPPVRPDSRHLGIYNSVLPVKWHVTPPYLVARQTDPTRPSIT